MRHRHQWQSCPHAASSSAYSFPVAWKLEGYTERALKCRSALWLAAQVHKLQEEPMEAKNRTLIELPMPFKRSTLICWTGFHVRKSTGKHERERRSAKHVSVHEPKKCFRFSRFVCFPSLLQFCECDQKNSSDENRITEVNKCISSREASPLSPGTFSFHTKCLWIMSRIQIGFLTCLIWINVRVSSASLKMQWCFLTGCFKLHNALIFIAIGELIKNVLRGFHAQVRWKFGRYNIGDWHLVKDPSKRQWNYSWYQGCFILLFAFLTSTPSYMKPQNINIQTGILFSF